MLVLKRKVSQCVLICSDISIMVTDCSHKAAYLGIDAPKFLPIHRKEIFEITNDVIPSVEALFFENQRLRQRVAELERGAA